MKVSQISATIQVHVSFAALDAAGDVIEETPAQARLGAITPLAAMGLYEQLHAARNDLRRNVGLPEIATPDAGLLVLAFLRHAEEEGAATMRELLRCFDETAQRVQMNRLEALPEGASEENGRLIDR